MAFLDFDTQTAANPWSTYPAGWQRSSATLVQISTVSSVEYFGRSGGTGGTPAGGVAGTTNTGGGAGGTNNGPGFAGKNGGSGVVFISVPTANYTGTTTGSPTVTTTGSNTVMQFTASGSYTA